MVCKNTTQATRNNLIASVALSAEDFKSEDAIIKTTVISKPASYDAMFLSGKHIVNGKSHAYGWLIKFPNGGQAYFTEEEFIAYFKIDTEET